MALSIYLCKYARNGNGSKEGNPHNPRLWELNIRQEKNAIGKSKGVVFHIVGGTGCRWAFKRRNDIFYSITEAWYGSRLVGHIDAWQIDRLERLLATVPLQHGHPSWNCQDWAWEAIKLMRQEKFVVILPATIADLKEEMEAEAHSKWDSGMDSD